MRNKIKFQMTNYKSKRLLHGLVAVVIFVLAFGAVAWRLNQTPDVFSDEIVYVRAGIRVATQGAMVWDSGIPIYIHPPLYFLAEAVFLRLVASPVLAVHGIGNIFTEVYQTRYLNAILAGVTAVALYLIGRRLRGNKLALLLVALFIIDPFGVRINRRAMIETMAMLLTLIGMAIFLTERLRSDGRFSPALSILSGFVLGAAVLTKELAFTAVLTVLMFGLWEYGRTRRISACAPALVAVGVSILTYGVYWFWVLGTSIAALMAQHGGTLSYTVLARWIVGSETSSGFLGVKFYALQRLIGVAKSGWNRPGVSLGDFLIPRLIDYGSSYLLLALGGAATVWLLLFHRHDRVGRLLGLWGLVTYLFYAFVAAIGAGHDQFYYYLLVPAILLIGYTLVVLPEGAARYLFHLRSTRRRLPTANRWIHLGRNMALVYLLCFVLTFDVVHWWLSYGIGQDNGYYQLAAFVQANLKPGDLLNASGDALKFQYFLPDQRIATAGTPAQAEQAGIHYFVLAPKDVQDRYGNVTPALAAWITTYGQRLFSVYGDSYGEISLYRVEYAGSSPSTYEPSPVTVQPPRGGYIMSFVVAFVLWMVFLAICALIAERRTESSWRLGRISPTVQRARKGMMSMLRTKHERA